MGKGLPSPIQKNWPLNPINGAHKQIIRFLGERREDFTNSPEFNAVIAPIEGLLCPLGIGNGIGNGNGHGLGLGKGKGRGRGRKLEDINGELQECAEIQSNDSTNYSEKTKEEPPF